MSTFELTQKWITSLIDKSKQSPRLRQHFNIHKSCQYLFNAIGEDSYIRPHRHSLDPKVECLIAIRGIFALITFCDTGAIQRIDHFGTELYQHDRHVCPGVFLPPETWHTVIALAPDSVLLEIKPGPFLANKSKESAKWSPEEGSVESAYYLLGLREKAHSSSFKVI